MIRAAFFAAPVLLLIGCGPPATAFCGLPSDIPPTSEVAAGTGKALLNGGAFEADATYKVAAPAALDIGLLDLGLAADTTGTSVEELVGRRAFPICVEFGERDEDTMLAQYLEAPSPASDATHTGALSILDAEGDVLVGRFAVDLAGQTFEDGVFRAEKRP